MLALLGVAGGDMPAGSTIIDTFDVFTFEDSSRLIPALHGDEG
jgi:hypothetical protein